MTIIKRKTFIIKHFARFAEQTDLQKKDIFIYLSSCFVSFCQYSFQFFPAVKNTALYSSQTHAGSFRYLTVFES